MNMVPQESMADELEDVAVRAERGRAFYFMFPGSDVSDRWLRDFEHVDTPAHAGEDERASTSGSSKPADQKPL